MTNSEKNFNNQPTGRGDPPHNTDNDMNTTKNPTRLQRLEALHAAIVDVMLEGVNIKGMLDRVAEEIVKERTKTATTWKR